MSAARQQTPDGVTHLDRLELHYAPRGWPFAETRRAEIDAHFSEHKRRKPALWNGRVLLLHEYSMSYGVLRGAFLETDFASFSAWRDWGYPEAGVADCFGAGAILTADGAFLLGVMGPHTAKAGEIYFPCGTPEPGDIVGNKVDFDRSLTREIAEETGLDAAGFAPEPGWTLAKKGARLALIKTLRTPDSAEILRARVLGHLAREQQPELAGLRLASGPEDLEPAVLDFVSIFLRHHWARPCQ
ncbi:MAG: NUDIX hydrolase [Pseudolabrys sp.]